VNPNPIKGRCCATVFHEAGMRFPRPRQCSRRAVITRELEGKPYEFCAVHDPVAKAAKASAKQAEWSAEQAKREARWKRDKQYADACKGMADPVKEVEALRAACRQVVAAMDAGRFTSDYNAAAGLCRAALNP
jgi:hypothetical protein